MLSLQEDGMEVTTFGLLMLEFIVLGTQIQNNDAVFLRITPDTLQHFQHTPVSFECGGSDGSYQLRGFQNFKEFDPGCDIKRRSIGFFCTIERVYPDESGEYWCETKGGERSNSVNITVTAGSVILESPSVPVLGGKSVTLRCRSNTNPANHRADFYRNGILLEGSSAEEMIINKVSKSDEGLYKCSISGLESPESWLAVEENKLNSKLENYTVSTILPPTHEENPSGDSQAPNALLLLWVLVAILVMVLLLVGFLHIWKRRDSTKIEATPSHSGENNHVVPADDVADGPDDVTYAAIVIKKRKDQDSTDAAENLSSCLEKNHSRKPQGEKGHKEQRHPTEDDWRDSAHESKKRSNK